MFGADTIFANEAPSRAPLASHPAFAWIMIGWCAALFGLATFVIAAAFSSGTILPIIFGFVAAILGAVCGFQFSKSVGAKTPTMPAAPSFKRAKSDDMTSDTRAASIISTADLGSASLDAPIEDAAIDEGEGDAFALAGNAISAPDADEGEEKPATYFEDPFAEDGIDGPGSPNDRHARPALGRAQFGDGDLSFGALEDRPDDANLALDDEGGAIEPSTDEGDGEEALELDAFELAEEAPTPQTADDVEIEDAVVEDEDTRLQEAEVISLKDRELGELSMPEMVERFAVGLQTHRRARANDPASRAVRPSDPRIAQAIRELPIGDLGKAASESDSETRQQADQTEAALRDALEKLQRMSDHG